MSIRVSIIDNLFDVAANTEKVAGAKIAAAIVHKNRIVAVATNSRKTHPFQKKYGRNQEAVCLHAEIHAAIKAMKIIEYEDFKKMDLYVARAKQIDKESSYTWGNAKPCVGCAGFVAEIGIKNVYFTTDEFGCIDYM